MLRIDKSENKLVRLTKIALAETGHCERRLQQMICSDPDTFCEEIGEKLFEAGVQGTSVFQGNVTAQGDLTMRDNLADQIIAKIEHVN
jgi:hypothetical protein